MSDTIIVGDGWISEHYFTTDARSQSFHAKTLERRAAWDAEEKEQRDTPRARFAAARPKLELDLARLAELFDPEAGSNRGDDETVLANAKAVQDRLIEILELDRHGLAHERTGPLLRISLPGIKEGAPLVVILARPVATVEEAIRRDAVTLPEPFQLAEGGEEFKSAARLTSALFVGDDAPDLVLILAGRWAVLAEQERWAEGRYLAVDIQLLCERNDQRKGGEIDRALTCLSAESIAPDADGNLWWQATLEESIKHTVGVSKDLRDGVRASIEIIANEVAERRHAKGLAPLPQSRAQPLAIQALRFLYRILFLLYAEASPELGVLPAGAPDYDQGYGLDRIRELVLVKLATPRAQVGTHLYESLSVLFRLVDQGHEPTASVTADDGEDTPLRADGLTFNPLRADLFQPKATALIDEVGLGNAALQRVLTHLLLSKESAGRDRGYISYASLGINQLGAVYEGLMSYTGFFAETDLYEVAKNGDDSKGSWVVPVDRADGIAAADFVREPDPVTKESKPVLHPKGSFVFRLAGRERQQSASYYTPEVLTKFTVGQALEELLDQDGRTSADEILKLTICEPALGSGAFAIEAVRQLADQYLRRRQDEVGERIDPDQYQRELQKVKAYIALHNVYGVDLNTTAVELAEISLWLDTMVQRLDAPWFGLHLRRGNSLIGARRAVFPRAQVSNGAWLKEIPRDAPLASVVDDIEASRVGGALDGGIHHFLLPAAGWGSSEEVNEAKETRNAHVGSRARVRAWRSGITAKPTHQQVDALVELAHRVEVLWQIAYRRLQLAEQESRRSIEVWQARLPQGGTLQREAIETKLADPNGAYQRLRRVMDAWTAMWFWPLTQATTVDGQAIEPPTLVDWIIVMQALLGREHDLRKKTTKQGARTLTSYIGWDSLNEIEQIELSFAQAKDVTALCSEHPRLVVCERVARREGFFHWELDFASVFGRGGFDLQLGNPPWVRPRTDFEALLAESDPWWKLAERPSIAVKAAKLAEAWNDPAAVNSVVDGVSTMSATISFTGAPQNYPHLQGLQPDLYRCFIEKMWQNSGPEGAIGMLHLESHFTDEKAGLLRRELYRRMRRHWHFVNELSLFEIQHQKNFGVTVHGAPRAEPNFIQACWLYNPETAIRSLDHDGSGPEPGLKDPCGNWDVRPHSGRITNVDLDVLKTWHEILEEGQDVPIEQTRMVYLVNRSTAYVHEKLSKAQRLGCLRLQFSRGWDESRDRRAGRFEVRWGAPGSWENVILQGSHLSVARPIYKTPNPTMKNKDDWSVTDLEDTPADAVPVTIYKPSDERQRYDSAFGVWRAGTEKVLKPVRMFYRVAWRNMAANTGERTLIAAIVPPGAAHIHGVTAAGLADPDSRRLAILAAFMASLVSDLAVRTAPKSTISGSTIERLPYAESAFTDQLALRALRLNCLTSAYIDLWAECYSDEFVRDIWTGGLDHARRVPLGQVGPNWTSATPLRIAADRRQALVEIDALVALTLGLSADELCTIYRTQFAVLYGNDRTRDIYDANGRLVPAEVLLKWRAKGDRVSAEDRTAKNRAGNTYCYELPFVSLDREADMRQAYAHFERILRERS
jgi:hypothetical protein